MNRRLWLFVFGLLLLVGAFLPVSGVETGGGASCSAKEPLAELYENGKFDIIIFEGTVKTVSATPDPERNDYPNCLYTLLVELNSVQSPSSSPGIAREVIICVPVMKDKKILAGNIFSPGDMISCRCARIDDMPSGIREIQVSDDIQSFEHQQYFAFGVKKITSFASGYQNFAKRQIKIEPIKTLPRDEAAAKAREHRIQSEIARIEEELKKHGGSFLSWKNEYMQTTGQKYQDMRKEHWAGWIKDSYFAAEEDESGYNTKKFISGIIPYNNYLKKNNIDLIILRIPFKGDFAARVLASDEFQENPEWLEFYYECLQNDIEIVDPMPEMWKHRFDFPLFYFYHISKEVHPLEGTSFIAAQVLSEILKRYEYKKSDSPISLERTTPTRRDPRFFWPKGNAKFNPDEHIVFSQVVRDGETIGSLLPDTESPFLLLSNSLFAYPWYRLGASVPGYTAYFIQSIPAWLYQDGIGNEMLRNLVANPQYLHHRKAVIMFSGDWHRGAPNIPKYLQDGAQAMTLEKTMNLLSDEIDRSEVKNFTFSRTPSGAVRFSQFGPSELQNVPEQDDKMFRIRLTVPPCEGKTTCMIRVNFERSSYLNITALIEQSMGTVDAVDTTTSSFGENIRADLYVPISNIPESVYLLFAPFYPQNEFLVNNIELWYY